MNEIIKNESNIESDNNLCRICLSKKLEILNLFDKISNLTYFDKLMVCIPPPRLNITENDPYSKKICTECCQLLEQAYEFHNLCLQSDRQLRESVIGWVNPSDHCIKSESNPGNCIKSEPEPDQSDSTRKLKIYDNEAGDSVKLKRKRRKTDKTVQNQDRQYECNICHRGFVLKKVLALHMTIHTGILSYTCEVCGKSFARRTSLTLHLKIHSNLASKKFQCTQCSYRTNYSCHIKRHSAIHSIEFPFTCSVCGKKTKNKQQLSTHVRIVHSTLSLPCELCGKIFRTNTALRKHIERHSKF